MPEGHTIHRLARDQTADLVGRVVTAASSQARFSASASRIDGQRITSIDAWGKHLFHSLDSGEVLHIHLGLIGKWFRRSGEAVGPATNTTRLRLGVDDLSWDLIGPMTCALVTPDEQAQVVAKLGPDPLRRRADPEKMWVRLAGTNKSIGVLLMEQDVVAGIGNVYRSEVLNIVGIDPRRPGRTLSRDEFDALWHETVRQLRLGVRRNKIVTMSAQDLPRPIGRLRRGEGRYAYKQTDCGRCHTLLDVYPLAGRTTWSCPTCQPR